MYTKRLILTITLFVCTSCELITDKPMEIEYTKSDKLNVVISLINIPENVTKYRLKSDSPNDVQTLKQKNVTKYQTRQSVILDTVIENDQNYSVELLKANGALCISKNVLQLIAKDIKTVTPKHKCLVQDQACKIQLDFENKCITVQKQSGLQKIEHLNTVIVNVDSPRYYHHLKWQGSDSTTLFFNEKQTFNLICHKNEITNRAYNLTWKQNFPQAKEFSITEQLPPQYRLMLQITLRKIDEGTAVYCVGKDNEISTAFYFEPNKIQKDIIKLRKIKYKGQKPVKHSCSKDQSLLRKNSTGHFTYYIKRSAVIRKSDNGSVFFCVVYSKPASIDLFTYYTKRDVYNEVMYIYEDSTADTQGGDNIVIWCSTVIGTVVIIAGGTALMWYKCCRCNNQQPIDSQQQIQVCPKEVMYAEISTLPCRLERPDPVKHEQHYATIIGVLEQHKQYPDAVLYRH